MTTEANAALLADELRAAGFDDHAHALLSLHAELTRAVGMLPRGLRELFEAREAAARQVRT